MAKKKVKYTPSLFEGQDDRHCFAREMGIESDNCGNSFKIDRHEIFFSRAYKHKSIKYGVWVNLCRDCHYEVHNGMDDSLDKALKKMGQKKFEEVYDHETFMKEFSKNRL